MNKFWSISFLALCIFVNVAVYAYEPVVKKNLIYDNYSIATSPVDASGTVIYASIFFAHYTSSIYDGVFFNWQFYFDYEDCTNASRREIFKATIPDTSLTVTDKLNVTSYGLYFNPKSGTVTQNITLAPKLAGRLSSTSTTYYLRSLDKFGDVYNPDYTFCNINSPRKIDITLYLNAFNTFVAIRTPGNPLGRVLTTTSRVGLGESMIKAIQNRSEDMSMIFYFRTRADAVPKDSLDVRITVNQFYWNRLPGSGATRSYRNLADDINLFYGARNYPIRSPVLDRTNAAAAMAVLF